MPTAGKKYPEKPIWGFVVNKMIGGTDHILTSTWTKSGNFGHGHFYLYLCRDKYIDINVSFT